jgi:hypothetical protein
MRVSALPGNSKHLTVDRRKQPLMDDRPSAAADGITETAGLAEATT